MKRTEFIITIDVEDDKGFEDMELLEKKIHYFLNNLYGTNTQVQWQGFNGVDSKQSKGTNNKTSSKKQALDRLAKKSCQNGCMELSEASIIKAQIRALQKQVEGFANALEFNDDVLKVHREALRAHRMEIAHLREHLKEHTAIGNPLHNDSY